ncbi:MAG: gamma-glutamyl-gamma-aminobutyrate hydrolase family protein [Rhodospirillales bacterium]|nr:gamma-glutamyl-gamma-aminobutyrate hydrolase family protein [Rhodospirillales bacterium]MBO6787891.1 gamma-glutamyl-gamma-aminobutyrate hydrolase family protein [Rhodospirillales bacterium]
MSTRPLIGVLLDYEASGSFSKRPHYALRTAYFDAVWKAGGLPVGIPYIEEARDAYLEALGGLIVPGGFYPFPAEVYGRPANGDAVHPRFAFERTLMTDALSRDLPTLGICAGMQVMAVARGATIYGDIANEIDCAVDHLNEKPAEQHAHTVTVDTGTRLHNITGLSEIAVNTAHNEALKDIPAGIVVSARAPDGIVEAIELPDRRFAIGVQWHPEFFLDDGDPNFRLFEHLIDAAGTSS